MHIQMQDNLSFLTITILHTIHDLFAVKGLHMYLGFQTPILKTKATHFHFLCFSKVPAFLNVVDIAGLVKGASQGNLIQNLFAHIFYIKISSDINLKYCLSRPRTGECILVQHSCLRCNFSCLS